MNGCHRRRYCPTPSMQEYIRKCNVQKAGETNANKLAQAITVFLAQPWRAAMARATALLYMDLYCPCLHQHKEDDDVLKSGETWRKIYAGLCSATEASVLANLNAGSPVIGKWWTFGKVSESRAKAHMLASGLVRTGRETDSANTSVVTAVMYQLRFAKESCEHYARDHFIVSGVAGRLHPSSLRDTEASLLERMKAGAVNCFVESMFAFVDGVLKRSSERMSSTTATVSPSLNSPSTILLVP